MKIGVTPFFSRNRKRLLNNIAKEDVIYPNKEKYNIEYSDLFMDVVNKVRIRKSHFAVVEQRQERKIGC